MKKRFLILFILLGAILSAGVTEDIVKLQNKITREQNDINEERKINKIRYKDNKGKLEEKNIRLDSKQREVDYKKAKLQFLKNNKNLALKIEDKKREIHFEMRKNNSDRNKIAKLMNERDKLQDQYKDKELKFEQQNSRKY